MAVPDTVRTTLQALVGTSTKHSLGCVSVRDAQRYARATGETEPIYFDVEAARAKGLPTLPLLPNLLCSIVEWQDGGANDDLRTDGTAGERLHGIDLTGVRVMGGGERMRFRRTTFAEQPIVLESRLQDVTERDTRSGPMLVLTYENSYRHGSDDAVLVECQRTILLR